MNNNCVDEYVQNNGYKTLGCPDPPSLVAM